MSDTRPALTLERVEGPEVPPLALRSSRTLLNRSRAVTWPHEVPPMFLKRCHWHLTPSCASRPLRGHSPATAWIIQNHARQRRRGRRDVTGRRGGADVARHGRPRGNRGFSCRVLASLARTPASEAALGAWAEGTAPRRAGEYPKLNAKLAAGTLVEIALTCRLLGPAPDCPVPRPEITIPLVSDLSQPRVGKPWFLAWPRC